MADATEAEQFNKGNKDCHSRVAPYFAVLVSWWLALPAARNHWASLGYIESADSHWWRNGLLRRVRYSSVDCLEALECLA